MKFYCKIAFAALLIETLTSPLRAVSFMLCSVIAFLLFFIFQYFISKKFEKQRKSEYILIASLLGCSLLQVFLRLWIILDSSISLPDFLFHLFGIAMGYLFYKSTKIYRVIILLFSLMSCGFLYFKGYDMWLHKSSFGTYTGKIETTIVPDFQFVNEQGDIFSLADFSGKYVVIDFWYTGCGICFKKFPEVQALYNKYRENPQVSVLSINSRLKKDADNVAFYTIRKEGYSFPVYRLDMEDPILLQLGVNKYPTVLIFDKEGKAVFRGNIENASKYIENRNH